MLSLMNKYRKACFKLALAEGDYNKMVALNELKELIAEVGKTADVSHWKDADYFEFAINYIVSHDHNGLFNPPKNN